MNIQDQIPDGWLLHNLEQYSLSKFRCELVLRYGMGREVSSFSDNPDEALAEACKKAREYNLWNLLEEK